MNGITNQTLSLDANNLIQECQNDIVTFSGISDALNVVRCSGGMSFVATGADQSLAVTECGVDNKIYDLGTDLSLTFYEPGGRGVISEAQLTVYGFAQDFGGVVKLQPLQTPVITSDGRGGSFLDLGSTVAGGIVHFAWDPPANLAAHIHT